VNAPWYIISLDFTVGNALCGVPSSEQFAERHGGRSLLVKNGMKWGSSFSAKRLFQQRFSFEIWFILNFLFIRYD